MLPQMTQQYLGRAPRHDERGCALILFCGFKWEEGSHEGAGRKHCGRAGNRNPGPWDLIFHSALHSLLPQGILVGELTLGLSWGGSTILNQFSKAKEL